MELFNETMLILMTLHLYSFTDFLNNIDIQESMGMSLVAHIGFYLFVNSSFVVKDIFLTSRLQIKAFYHKKIKIVQKKTRMMRYKKYLNRLLGRAYVRRKKIKIV
jgi:hypothetical protein